MATATKSQVTAPVQTAEELEAAEAEQIVPISKEGLIAHRRYHRNMAKMKELKAQMDADQEFLENECAEKHAKKLSYRGVVAVEIVGTTKTTNDYKGLWKKFPEVQAVFISEFQTKDTDATRFDAKKPV